jgi:hypothetical protein
MKLDPVKYEAFRQKDNEQLRKHRLKLKAERERRQSVLAPAPTMTTTTKMKSRLMCKVRFLVTTLS